MNDTPGDDDDWDLKGVVGLDKVERGVVKPRFRYFQESCRSKRWRVPETVAEAVQLANERFKQDNDQSAQVADNVAPVAFSSNETEVVSLSTILMKVRKEGVSAIADLDVLCAMAKFV